MSNKNQLRRPLAEGSLKAIFEIFLYPIIKVKPHNWHLQDWLNEIFCVDERIIKRFTAITPFQLRGKIKGTDTMICSTQTTSRKIKVGAELWIRTDRTTANKIDVEINNGNGSTTTIFQLNRAQLQEIIPHLEEKPFKISKRSIYSWEKDFEY